MKRVHVFIVFILVMCIASAIAQDNCKCCSENYKAFDFWKGDWTVYTTNGQFAGKNKIDKIQDQCILRENWVSATPGYTGTSYNFYNAKKDHWEQIWIDNQGGVLHLKGGLKDGSMVLKSDEEVDGQGKKIINRITWTPDKDGSVRQLWEMLVSGEETKILFDGLYKKE